MAVEVGALNQGLNGALIDGDWYVAVTKFAEQTGWLHGPVLAYTDVLGLGLFAVLLLAAWWTARSASTRIMTAALWAPIAIVLAYLVNGVIKTFVAEPRPCQQIPHVVTMITCEAPTDYSFPSNHAAISGALAVAVLLVHRGLGVVAVVAALAMGASRVYVGSHYPHDVVVGLIAGGLVAAVTGCLAMRVLTGVVGTLRVGRLHPLLAAGHRSEHTPSGRDRGDVR
jgi:membrane-associated phospholipid phosphatase